MNETCTKCGHEDVRPSYVQSGDMEIDAEKSNHSGKFKYECPNCDYVWYGPTMDKIKEIFGK